MNSFSIILLVTALISGILAVYTLQFRKAPGALSYSVMMFAIMLYAFGYAFELSSETLPEILFWLKIQYLGIAFLPTIFIILALQYVGKEHWLNIRIIGTLVTFSLITIISQETNFLNSFYIDFKLNKVDGFVLSNFTKGKWYWVHQIYSNIAFFMCAMLYLQMMLRTSAINKVRAAIMFLSAIIPWIFYAFYITGHSPYGIDLNPFSASIVGILGALGLFRFQLLGFEPLALEKVFNSMHDGVIIIDRTLNIVNFNAAAQEIIKELTPQTKETNFEKVFKAFPEIISLIKTDLQKTIDIEIEEAGTLRHFQVSATPVYDSQDRFLGKTLIFTDITERKNAEQVLINNEAYLKDLNATKDKFFSIIAHDLQGPFSSLMGLTEVLSTVLEQDKKEKALHIAKVMNESSKQTNRLLQNLLEWSKIQRDKFTYTPEKLNLKQVIKEEADNLSNVMCQKRISIDINTDSTLLVYTDPNTLKTTLRNLISNAIKYSYPQGKIEVGTECSGSEVIVSVKDSGIGISDENQQKIFRIDNNFSANGTGNEKGTGLGLILCKEFVQMYNGRIWVESEPDKGSVFKFSLIPYNEQMNN